MNDFQFKISTFSLIKNRKKEKNNKKMINKTRIKGENAKRNTHAMYINAGITMRASACESQLYCRLHRYSHGNTYTCSSLITIHYKIVVASTKRNSSFLASGRFRWIYWVVRVFRNVEKEEIFTSEFGEKFERFFSFF